MRYATDNFLPKNKDYVVAEHAALLATSTAPLVRMLFGGGDDSAAPTTAATAAATTAAAQQQGGGSGSGSGGSVAGGGARGGGQGYVGYGSAVKGTAGVNFSPCMASFRWAGAWAGACVRM